MKKNRNLIVLLGALVVLITGGSILYNRLSKEYRPNQLGVLEDKKDGSGKQTQDSKTGEGGSAGSTIPEESAKPTVPGEEAASGEEDSGEKETKNPAPDFSMVDMEGEEVLLSDLFGKPIVLNFWATWCGYCKEEMPMIQEVYEELADKVTFVMVDMTDGIRETVGTAKKYLEEMEFTFPVYFDTEQEAAYAYGVTGLPITYFLDAEGNLVAYAGGRMDEDMLRRGISMIMEEEEETD